MDQRVFPPLSLTRSKDSVRSNGPSTPKSSYIATLPESPVSPLAPRSSSPGSRAPITPASSRPPSQLRPRDSRPPFLPFRRISLPAVPNQKRDSVASVFSVDSVLERDEQDDPQQQGISSSLPTESSMPQMALDASTPLVPPPPLPISSSSSSSPSRRAVLLPTSPTSPTRVRPRPTPTQNSSKGSAQPTRSGLGAARYSRRAASKAQAVGRDIEREEKRRKVLQELLDTEQTYVDGLDLVYNHFLAPLIESLASSHPLLTSADLNVVFPGFIDILNFNRSFLSDLRAVLVPALMTPTPAMPIPSANPSSASLNGPSFPNEGTPSLLSPSAERVFSISASSSVHPASLIYSHGYLPSNPDLSASAILEDAEPEVARPALPNVAPLLAQHVPYLKLYKPFVTAFPASMERLAKLSANEGFRSWLKEKERDPVCGMLELRSWLLSVVQRCPRYLLLVKDLVKHTGEEEEGYSQLMAVLGLLSEITGSLNTSLADHTAVLALLDLQRGTSSLPPGFSFVAPGRALIRRGRLRMSGQEVMREDGMRRGIGQEVIRRVGIAGWDGEVSGEREVVLFSDCVVWLEREWEWGLGSGVGPIGGGVVRHSAVGIGRPLEPPRRPTIGRTRSKSEAELPTLKSQSSGLASSPEGQRAVSGSSSVFVKSSRKMGVEDRWPIGDKTKEKPMRPVGEVKRPALKRPIMVEHGSSGEERWRFKGMAGLMDVEVVISPRNATQIDFLSPEGSFALYASSYDEREEWIHAIRSTKATLLASFNVMHPDSTLTSSSSTKHLRRVLQALPYPPGEATIRGARAQSTGRKSILRKGRTTGRQTTVMEENEDADESSSSVVAAETKRKERRGRVEHFVPAIWVPDRESAVCMRCQLAFGWRRRRHHCRLCGRVVCAACSQKNFFVMDPAHAEAPKSHKPERACSLCYDAVFPVIQSSHDSLHAGLDRGGTIMPLRNSPARPRVLKHLISTPPVTTPAVERGQSSPGLLTPSTTGPLGSSPSGNTIMSSASSQSNVRFAVPQSHRPEMVASPTTQTVTSLDSQRTVQPRMSSDLSSLTSNSQSSRPRSLDIGRRFAAASAFLHTEGVTAQTKVTGRGKGRRLSLVSSRKNVGGAETSASREMTFDGTSTLGRGAAAQQLSELLGRSPK